MATQENIVLLKVGITWSSYIFLGILKVVLGNRVKADFPLIKYFELNTNMLFGHLERFRIMEEFPLGLS